MIRITDLRITKTATGYNLYIPLKTGHLEIDVEIGELPKLDRFIETALYSDFRRFGENPTSRDRS